MSSLLGNGQTDNVAEFGEPAYHSTYLAFEYIIRNKSLDNGTHLNAAYNLMFGINVSTIVRPKDFYTTGKGEGFSHYLTTFNGKNYTWDQNGDSGIVTDSRYYNQSLLFANMQKCGSGLGVINSLI